MAEWQQESMPFQLHPGDLGWIWWSGTQKLAESVRVWRRYRQILAVDMVDDDSALIRMALAPTVDEDAACVERLLADLSAAAPTPRYRFQVSADRWAPGESAV